MGEGRACAGDGGAVAPNSILKSQILNLRSFRSASAASVCVLILAAYSLLSPRALAQDRPSPPADSHTAPAPGRPREVTLEEAQKQRARLNKLVFAAFERKDWPAAEAALRELIPYDADNFVPWYNLACALALQGKAEESMKMIDQSVARGFSDLRTLETDPQLAPVRSLDRYKALVTNWDKLLDRRVEANLDGARRLFTSDETAAKYNTERDDQRRLVYLSAFDPRLFADAKAQIETLTTWWNQEVAPPLTSSPPHPSSTPWVTVVLPTRPDYARWAYLRFGDGWERVGGQYSHDNKLLVAQDLGSTLRHEYWHVLNWRDQDARGQRHPIWLMEGLCSLVEDVEFSPSKPGAKFRPVPSWRTNQARRLARAGGLMPWDVLFALDANRFTRTRPLAQYAQSRAIFLWLYDEGKLRDWYTAYTAGYAEDPTGAGAFAAVFHKPAKEVERDFRLWLRELPEVQESIGNAPANLPFDVGPGAGDGPTVDAPPDYSLTTSNTKALGGREGLKDGDVITAIDGKPVRDLNDLARILGAYDAGTRVELTYRRKRDFGKATVVLVPPR